MTSSRFFANNSRVFWGCFVAMLTCGFGFVVRTQVIGEWQLQFNLSETEKGDILGVGFWPFALSIFLLSAVIDRFGYGRAAVIGFIFHLVSTALLLTATSARMLYWGTFFFALSNGTVEAYINPTVAAMNPRDKIKWLNILHAGWPAGMILAGLLAISLGHVDWRWKVGLVLLPTLLYCVLLVGTRFPVSERVAAGVSYRDSLTDFGALGALVTVYLISLQVCENILKIEQYKFVWPLLPAVLAAGAFGLYVRSLGKWVYFVLMLIMIPLATNELGVDSWITDLMGPEMQRLSLNAGWVLVYTSVIMTLLRCFAGPLVHRLSPLGLLASCALIAIVGLFMLSKAAGVTILLAATIYGIGKAFAWPTMLGIVSEQFPKGGALAMNCIGGVGMLGLSVGMVFLGNIQDRSIDRQLVKYDATSGTNLHSKYLTDEKRSIFGRYLALNQTRLAQAPPADKEQITQVQTIAKKSALSTATIFPFVMLVAYLGLIIYYWRRGGYRVKQLPPYAAHEAMESAETEPIIAM